MQLDSELDTWRRQWQAQGDVPADLKRRVERELRRRRWGLAAQMVVTVVFGGGTAIWAILSERPAIVLLAAVVWVVVVVGWIVAFRLEKGAGRPAAATTAAFLDFSILRCRARLQGIMASAVLYPIFLTFMLGWTYYASGTQGPVWTYLTSPRALIILAISLALGVLAWRRYRALTRELENVLALRQQLDESPASTRRR